MNAGGATPKIPLKGLAIGDGLCDPINQFALGDFLFQTGLTDENGRDKLHQIEQKARQHIEAGKYDDAHNVREVAVAPSFECTTMYLLTNVALLPIFSSSDSKNRILARC